MCAKIGMGGEENRDFKYMYISQPLLSKIVPQTYTVGMKNNSYITYTDRSKSNY